MIPAPFTSGAPPQLQISQPVQPAVGSFWQAEHVNEHLRNLKETVDLVQAVQKELEGILLLRRSSQIDAEICGLSSGQSAEEKFLQSSRDSIPNDTFQCFGSEMPLQISETVKEKRIGLNFQESLSLEAANSLMTYLKSLLVPFTVITNQTTPWEQRSVAVKLVQKLQKTKRNKRWRKRKRKHVAELLHKERESYDKADQDADEWRAREIAKDIAKRKVERMKEIAKLKANEERRRLETELELVLVVEKLQELRSIRIQKLKKQGHFLPEEDDKFLERVRAAVEEEERQAAAAADTGAAKEAIATAEVSRKTVQSTGTGVNDVKHDIVEATLNEDKFNGTENVRSSVMDTNCEPEPQKFEAQSCSWAYDSVANLPSEFYHYYHGSSTDMGTLIEVRRMWDAFIRPGGSRIPSHWVQPSPPADSIWASYLVRPN